LDTGLVPVEDAAGQLATALFQLRQGNSTAEERSAAHEQVQSGMAIFAAAQNPKSMGALKLLSPKAGGHEFGKAKSRFVTELRTYKSIRHQNLITLLDSDENEEWGVTEYFPEGSLDLHQIRFIGDAEAALLALSGLVAGVVQLHEHQPQIVH